MKGYCTIKPGKHLPPKITAKELIELFNSNRKIVGLVMKQKGIIGFVSGVGGAGGMNTNYPKREAIKAMSEYYAGKREKS